MSTGEAGRAVSEDREELRRRFHQVVPRQFLLATAWIVLANLIAGRAFPLLFGESWAIRQKVARRAPTG